MSYSCGHGCRAGTQTIKAPPRRAAASDAPPDVVGACFHRLPRPFRLSLVQGFPAAAHVAGPRGCRAVEILVQGGRFEPLGDRADRDHLAVGEHRYAVADRVGVSRSWVIRNTQPRHRRLRVRSSTGPRRSGRAQRSARRGTTETDERERRAGRRVSSDADSSEDISRASSGRPDMTPVAGDLVAQLSRAREKLLERDSRSRPRSASRQRQPGQQPRGCVPSFTNRLGAMVFLPNTGSRPRRNRRTMIESITRLTGPSRRRHRGFAAPENERGA